MPQKAIFGGFEQFLWGFKGRQSKIHDGAQQSKTSAYALFEKLKTTRSRRSVVFNDDDGFRFSSSCESLYL